MATYSRHDVVRVPFPFTDRTADKNHLADADSTKVAKAVGKLFD